MNGFLITLNAINTEIITADQDAEYAYLLLCYHQSMHGLRRVMHRDRICLNFTPFLSFEWANRFDLDVLAGSCFCIDLCCDKAVIAMDIPVAAMNNFEACLFRKQVNYVWLHTLATRENFLL